MKFNIDSVKQIFKNEWKIISIAAGTILLILLIVIFTMFKVSSAKLVSESDNDITTNIPDFSKGTSTPIVEDVTIYIFKSSTCPHCKKALAFFESIASDYDYLNVVAYEVSKDDNSKLMQAVATELDKGRITGVPFIVIGDNFTLNGYSEARNESLIDAIKLEHENQKYKDVVKSVIEKNKDLKVTPEKIGN